MQEKRCQDQNERGLHRQVHTGWRERNPASSQCSGPRASGFLDEARLGSLPPRGGPPDFSALLYQAQSPGRITPLTLPACFSPCTCLRETPEGNRGHCKTLGQAGVLEVTATLSVPTPPPCPYHVMARSLFQLRGFVAFFA